MKYSLLLIISLFSFTAFSAKNNVEKEGGNILDLRNNRVVFIAGNDTIQSEKKGNIFYFPLSKDIVINKVLLPDTAKASHSFKVTSNGKLIGEESKDKRSHDQNIQVLLYNVYTLYWGGVNWKICCSDEFSRNFDLKLLDTKQISIKNKTGEKIVDIDDNGFFELNDTVIINSVQFPTAGILAVECDGDRLLKKNVRRIEDNFGLTLYKGKSYIFTLGDKTWKIGAEAYTSTDIRSIDIISLLFGIFLGLVLSIIVFVLFKKRKLIKKMFVHYKKLTTNEGLIQYRSKDGNLCTGAAAFPDGFYTLDDGRSILINKEIIELIFPAGSLKRTDCDDKVITINCEEDNPQPGDIAYPNGNFILPDGTQIIVEEYKIQKIKKDDNCEGQADSQVPVADLSQSVEFTQNNWCETLTDSTKSQIESLDLKAEDFDSYDELCSTLAVRLISIRNAQKSSTSHQDNQKEQKYAEDNFIKDLIKEMEKKPNIRLAFKGKNISSKADLIANIDLLFMMRKPTEVSYTLEELSSIVERKALPAIDADLREKVLNVYVRRYLNNKFNLNWDEKTILSNAINGVEIIKSTELNSRALDIIGGKVGLKFHTLEEFVDAWNIQTKEKKSPSINVDSETLSRLQLLATSKHQTISEILDELENLLSAPTSTLESEEIRIDGRSVDEVKLKLEEYEKLKPLSELTQFGTTVEAIKAELSHRGEIELANAIKNAVSEAVPDIQMVESFENLKKVVEGIYKADSAEKMANTIGRISKLAEEMTSLQDERDNALNEKENALKEKDEVIINEIKTHYHNLFNKDLSSEDSISAIGLFVEQVKEGFSELNQEVIEKDGIISNKIEEIKTLCEDYSNIILTAFEQIENNLNDAYKNAKSSDALPNKFIQRVIQNDAFNVSDFMDELKKIVNSTSLSHKNIIEFLRNLFLDTVQNNSWVQTLSHIYLYVQNSTVASYFNENKIDVSSINASFILTEQMMRALGIELHYPKLFEDIFDSNLYDESTLSDVKDYVNDVKELVGDRQGVIIDMFRLGYTSDGQTHKAKVTRFN